MTTFTALTLNAGKGTRQEFIDAMQRVSDIAGAAGIGFQEIDAGDKPREHHLLRKAFPGRTWACWNTRQPILLPAGWDLLGENRIHVAKGVEGLNPPSLLTEAIIGRKVTGERLVWINAHSPWDNSRLWRERRKWRRHLRRRIRFWQRHGYIVVVSADMNRQDIGLDPALMARGNLLDVLMVFEPTAAGADEVVDLLRSYDVDLPIEPQHNAVGARLRIRRRRRDT